MAQITGSGDTDVGASVDNPVITSSPTPTTSISPSGSVTLTPSLSPGVSPSVSPSQSISQTPTPTLGPGQFNLDISGYVSPFASIIMTSNSTFVRSTVADKDGNFFISQIGVSKGFSDFCLQAVDFKRVGDSYTCFKIPPVTASTSKKDIFLPPTLALTATKIGPSGISIGFGYGMPGAKIFVHITKDSALVTTADKDGLYRVEIKNLKPGIYYLYATSTYKNKNSEKPNKSLRLESLSAGGSINQGINHVISDLFTSIVAFFSNYGWLIIPVFILIIILISKRARDNIRNTISEHSSFGKDEVNEYGHHRWFLGF